MSIQRSPILGYNHNFRHRGLIFHVQTEDSGVTNPHIFTHLFHGGVILSSRRLDYDADASEETVKSLMQAQHKAVLRDLKRGTFDDKIDAYLGEAPGLLPRPPTGDEPRDTQPIPTLGAGDTTEKMQTLTPDEVAEHLAEEDSVLGKQARAATLAVPPPVPATARPARKRASASPPTSDPVVTFRSLPKEPSPPSSAEVSAAFRALDGSAVPEAVPLSVDQSAGSYSQVRRRNSVPPPIPAPVADAPTERVDRAARRAADSTPVRGSQSVVVSRPAVIIGAPPKVVGTPAAAARRSNRDEASIFGQDLISEKSLDEVILAYLSEDGSEE